MTERSAFLLRDTTTTSVTLGRLMTDTGETFHILEPPWKDNASNVSCVPAGRYECTFLPRSASGKYRNVYHVRSVPTRTGILIHQGNVVRHTLGCLIIGLSRGHLAGEPAVLNSRTALRRFVEEMGRDPFTLHIWGNQHV